MMRGDRREVRPDIAGAILLESGLCDDQAIVAGLDLRIVPYSTVQDHAVSTAKYRMLAANPSTPDAVVPSRETVSWSDQGQHVLNSQRRPAQPSHLSEFRTHIMVIQVMIRLPRYPERTVGLQIDS